MRVSWFLARSHLRRHTAAVGGLVLVATVVAALTVGTATVAQRTRGALDRYRVDAALADVDVQSWYGCEDGSTDCWYDAASDLTDRLAATPGVTAVGQQGIAMARPAGTSLLPLIDIIIDVSVNGGRGWEVDRLTLTSGRLPDPTSADEAVISQRLSSRLGVGIGDEVVLETMTARCVVLFLNEGDFCDPDGPAVPLQVVGIGATPEEVLSPSSFPAGGMFLGPGFHRRWADEVAHLVGNHAVRLAPGAGGPGILDDVLPEESFASPRTEILDRATQGLRVQEVAAWIATAVVALVGTAVLAQAVARHVGRSRTDRFTLQAVGLTVAALRAQGALTAVPVAAAGLAVGVLLAAAAVPAATFGVTGRLDPSPGAGVDPLAVAAGAALVLGTCVAAWVLSMSTRSRGGAVTRPSRWGAALARSGAPVALVIGARNAWGSRADGAAAVPARSSLAGIALGLAGVAAVLSFGASLSRLVDESARQGTTFDVEWGPGDEATDEQALAQAEVVADLPSSDQVALARVSQVRLGGRSVDGYGWLPVAGDLALTVIEGRHPRGADEVALGPLTMADLDVGIGDLVELPDGSGRNLEVVGAVLVPALDSDETPGRGLALDYADAGALLEGGFPTVLVTATPGAPVDRLRSDIEAAVGGFTRLAPPHASIGNVTDVRAVPTALAAGLGALAVAAMGHALVVSGRRRRRSTAVLRALGFGDGQLRSTVLAQALVLVGVGAVVGVPLGVAVGRAAWRPVAEALGVASDPVTPAAAVVLLVAGAALCAVAWSLAPARAAVALNPASTLRTE